MSDPLRFFVPPESLQGDPIIIEGDAHHHLRNVLRVKPGAKILLLDGNGGYCNTEVISIDAKQSTARVLDRGARPLPDLKITLMQALPKGDKFDLVLQKGTELGAHRFQPILTEHAIPNLTPERMKKRTQRWQRIVSEAARQCRRYTLPEVTQPQPLNEALAAQATAFKLILWESGAVPIAQALPSAPPKEVLLLIGPEGGFSEQEITAATNAGFQAIHLGPRILRTETAGLAATPILQYLYGDWLQAPTEQD
jgi:16S rRNA (uracil1498-N3)-methyltransferase